MEIRRPPWNFLCFIAWYKIGSSWPRSFQTFVLPWGLPWKFFGLCILVALLGRGFRGTRSIGQYFGAAAEADGIVRHRWHRWRRIWWHGVASESSMVAQWLKNSKAGGEVENAKLLLQRKDFSRNLIPGATLSNTSMSKKRWLMTNCSWRRFKARHTVAMQWYTATMQYYTTSSFHYCLQTWVMQTDSFPHCMYLTYACLRDTGSHSRDLKSLHGVSMRFDGSSTILSNISLNIFAILCHGSHTSAALPGNRLLCCTGCKLWIGAHFVNSRPCQSCWATRQDWGWGKAFPSHVVSVTAMIVEVTAIFVCLF